MVQIIHKSIQINIFKNSHKNYARLSFLNDHFSMIIEKWRCIIKKMVNVHFQWSFILKVEHVQLSSFSMMTFSFGKYETLLLEKNE